MNRAAIWFAIGLIAVIAGALALRLPRLGQRPMHCDEANQAFRAAALLETGVYRYERADHHGPSLCWFTRPALWLAGAADFAHSQQAHYRIVPVLFSVATILLVWLLADALGRPAALIAGLLLAISPAMVFYGRYFVQETLLTFFTLAAIGCLWRYTRTRSVLWAAAAGACFGLLHATKETWILAAVAMAAATLLALAWTRWRDGRLQIEWRPLLSPRALVAAAVAALIVAVAFYSSFGRDWRGPIDSVLAYWNYLHRGSGVGEGGMHVHAWYYYLQLLVAFHPARGFFWSEGLIVALALVGAAAALARGGLPQEQRPVGRFLAFYTLVLTALYAAIPYKTPWCMLSFLQGMILLAGIGAWALLSRAPGRAGKAILAVALVIGLVHLGREAYALSFRFSADQRNPYVYAHTSPDILNLERTLERVADVAPEGHQLTIHVVTPENYWPLPWYLRRFDARRVGYWQDPGAWASQLPNVPRPAVVILTSDVQPAVDAALSGAYNRQMVYGLRPGVLLSVYVREDLWQRLVGGGR
jgi:uncharacterized protein (TIGR03663 family)